MYTHCILCQDELKRYDDLWYFTNQCDNGICSFDDMTKFSATYKSDTLQLIKTILWVDKFYIKTHYKEQITEVFEIQACFLFPMFTIPRILKIDESNPHKIADKLRELMVFT